MKKQIDTDVAIVGGGPAGSACGSLLRKYAPHLKVAIFEREQFPREHVGESLLPSACKVVHEMGAWDDVERANFPIKIGATYRWGNSPALWDFEFIPTETFVDQPRPGKFAGQRAQTAFQVERSRFDEILLNNARERGCDVYQKAKVSQVLKTADHVDGLVLEDGTEVRARQYVDASGSAAVIRKAMGVPVQEHTQLKNVAFWGYWENTDWAVSIGTTATRILVLSLSWGWIWFIPLGPTRTSIGLVCPAEHYKSEGLSPEELYKKALLEEPKIQSLTKTATLESPIYGTKDWSFLADRLTGDNWFLAGECAGFADPILSAGVTLAVTGARELAFSLIAILNRTEDPAWLKASYEQNQRARISQHIRFADFWYSANGQFSDLKEFTREIAKDAGLELNANEAFRWLGTGGFTSDITQLPAIADISITGIKQITQRFTETEAGWSLNGVRAVRLDLDGAKQDFLPSYSEGKISRIRVYERGGKLLPLHGLYGLVQEAVRREPMLEGIVRYVVQKTGGKPKDPLPFVFQMLEGWLNDGWLIPVESKIGPAFSRVTQTDSGVIRTNRDISMD